MSRPSIVNPLSELNRRRDADLKSRRLATTILSPEAVGGKLSSARLLSTTLGGVRRPITDADLVAFRKRAQALAGKLREGLTAQEIIDQSRPLDRERARTDIPTAIPTRLRAGQIMFTTSSGPGSKVTRHFVSVEFPGYGSALAMPGTPLQAAAELGKAPLKFDCDCPHHRYRFRFIVSAMGANAGRAETGFPKLTNPTLVGIACKHVLRTMAELQGSMGVRRMVAQMIEADRSRINQPVKAKPRVIAVAAAEADRMARARKRAITTTDERSRKALLAGISKHTGKQARNPGAAELAKAMDALKGRPDVTAAVLLRAINSVLREGATK